MKHLVEHILEALKINSKSKVYTNNIDIIESELNNKFNVRLTKTGGFEIISKNIENLKPGDRKYLINGEHNTVRWTTYRGSSYPGNKWEVTRLIKNNLNGLDECIKVLKNYIDKNDKS